MKGYILITGASSGIGLAATDKFIKEGYHVFGSVRQPEDAARLSQAFPNAFTPLIFDVADVEALSKAEKSVRSHVGAAGLAGLVNNAGIAVSGPLLHIPLSDFQQQLEVNVSGVLRVTQAFAELLGAGYHSPYPPGRIMNISSISGLISQPFLGPYCASKFALEALSDSLRLELSIYGIPVVVIQPGPVQTGIWSKAREDAGRFLDTDYAPVLKKMKRFIDYTEKNAMKVEELVEVLFKAFHSPKPKARYLVAHNKWIIKLGANFLPDGIKDRLVKRQLKALMPS